MFLFNNLKKGEVMKYLVSYILGVSAGTLFMQDYVVPRVIASMLFAAGVYYAYTCMKEN